MTSPRPNLTETRAESNAENVEVHALKSGAVGGVICSLLILGCAGPRGEVAHQPTWIEAVQFIPASEAVPPLPVPAGWSVVLHEIVHASPSPFGLTNDAGTLITWLGMLRFEGSAGEYLVEYLGGEFGPAFYPLFPITHTGPAGETFIAVRWTQPQAPEFRLLKQSP